MVDEARVLRLLRGITDNLSALRAEAAADATRRADRLWLAGVKYLMVTTVEGCIDVAQHIAGSEGWAPPRNNGDAMRLLGDRGVIGAGVADSLRAAVGFRNVLVHEYIDVDDAVVVTRLADLSDLERFVVEVNDWLDRHR